MTPRRVVLADGQAELWLGDCLEVLPTLGRVDAVITDPPYGIGYEYLGYEDTRENLAALVAGFVPASRMIAKRVAIFCGVNNLDLYPRSDWVIAWHWRGTNTYGKYGINQWQPIIVYGEDVKGFGSVNGVLKSDAIYYEGGNCDEVKRFDGHPCPKNLGIMARCLARLTAPGDLVADPFMGSGTTGVAAIQGGRRFIGIEREPRYFDIACRRIEAAHAQRPLFEPAPAVAPVQMALEGREC